MKPFPGIGPQRLKAIWKAFSSLEEMANTEATEISERAKLPVAVAEAVRERAKTVQRKQERGER